MIEAQLQGFRLSPQQRRLWLLMKQGCGSAYRASCQLRIQGEVDGAALRSALEIAAQRHEILSTNFRSLSAMSLPLQVIQSELRPSFEVAGHETLEGLEFDLEEGSPLRAWLCEDESGHHLLTLSLPSMCSDGPGMVNLAQQVAESLQSLLQGVPLQGEPLQYADLSEWLNSLLEAEQGKAGRQFWRKLAAQDGFSPRLALEGGDGGDEPFELGSLSWDLTPSLGQGLEALSRECEVESETILLACWQLLLWRFADERTGIVAGLFDGRPHEELRGALGPLSRYLPLPCQPRRGMPFRKLVEQLSKSARQARKWQESFDWDILPQPGGNSSGYFPWCFESIRLPRPWSLGALRFQVQDLRAVSDRFKVRLSCLWMADRLRLSLDWGAGCFGQEEAECLRGALQATLQDLIERPDASLAEISLLSEKQRRQLVVEFNQTASRFLEGSLQERFEKQAKRASDQIALAFEGRRTSFGELDARGDRLAGLLRSSGIGPECLVGVCLPRSDETIAALIGILKAGAAYLPLDAGQPALRLAKMLQEAGSPLLIGQASLPAAALPPNCRLLPVEQAFPAGSGRPAVQRRGKADGQALAYVLFTSGSTGRPKAVAVEQRQLLNYLDGVQKALDLPGGAAYAVVSTVAADLGNTMIWPSLLNGGCLHVASAEGAMDAELWSLYCSRQRVDCLKIVPSHLEALLSARQPDRALPLQRLVLGGEALKGSLVKRIQQLAPGCRIDNHYGPTETTVGVLTHQIQKTYAPEEPVPLGHPLANCQAYLLDGSLRPVACWLAGEIHIGGSNLSRGYPGQPSATALRFIPDPFSGQRGARLYRSGDLGRHLPQAGIQFLGRQDSQVKLRGFRVELGEIESVLLEHPEVSAAAALLLTAQDEARLAAFWVPRHPLEEPADSQRLQAFLSQRLPGHMIPSTLVMLDALPLTANGKVDRQALQGLAPEDHRQEDDFASPRTPTEELLANIWTDVLKVDAFGVHSDFFELGGHSLRATQLVSRIREVFGVEIRLATVFEAPRLDELAGRIEQARLAERGEASLPPIRPTSRRRSLPLSFAQQRLWFLSRLEAANHFYNFPAALRLQGRLRMEVLEATLNEVIRRHEALRTTFHEQDGQPVQRVHRPARLAVPLVDLHGLPENRREQQAAQAAALQAHRLFDLGRGPLMSVWVMRMSDREHVLAATFHHLTIDQWSVGVLTRELMAIYEAVAAGRPSPLPELRVQYADYAVWQRRQLSGEACKKQLDYWVESLKGAPALLELPADRPRPARLTYRGGRVAARWPEDLLHQVEALGRSQGATLFMTMLAGLLALLQRYSGQTDLLVGTPIANRTRGETEDLIGFFLNTLVLRTDASGDPGFSELVKRVRQVTLGAYEHQDIPFEQVVEALQPGRSLNHAPLFQVMFSGQNAPIERLQFSDLEVSDFRVETRWSKFDLTFWVGGWAHGLEAALEYSSDLFDATTAERLLRHLHTLLQGAGADPDCSLHFLPLMDEEERRQVLQDWNDTRTDYPRQSTIAELFNVQAEARPDRVAVAIEEQQLSYARLALLASRVARRLVDSGVGHENPVGILSRRSLEMTAGILGILKAGAAYLPLDPSYPPERLIFMLEDSGASALLVQDRAQAGFPFDGKRLFLAGALKPTGCPEEGESDGWAQPKSLAYIIYTSGSTGLPKGVEVPHRAVARLVKETGYARLSSDQVYLQLAPISFDASTLELWGSLLNGARLNLLPAEKPTLDMLGQEIIRHQVTILWLTTPLFQLMVDQKLPALSTVQQILAGGEVMSVSHLHRALQGGVRCLVNCYGPTESTTFTTCFPIENASLDWISVPIGPPIANTTVYVLDGHLNPAPIGIPGELCIGGDGLARGYRGRPQLTAERFVSHPWGEGERLYRSGDRVRWRAGGYIEFLGRLDRQLKIRGFRVEPGEIEVVLGEHPQVADCALVAHQDEHGQKRLVGYAVPRKGTQRNGSGQSLEPEALQRFLLKRLPGYMVPAAILLLDALPLTPSGKLDRSQLPDDVKPQSTGGSAPPATPGEELLASIWSSVLGVEQVGRQDSFFELGGHSLLAMQTLSRIRQAFGVELPLRTLFESPLLSDLAQRIDEAGRREAGTAVPPLQRAAQREDLPLSFAQQRLWFLDQLEPGNSLYNIAAGFRLSGSLKIAALRAALQEILRRHEALRTVFPSRQGNPVQLIRSQADLPFASIDLSALASKAAEQELQRLARQEAERPFDLTSGPLLRFGLLRLSSGEHALLAAMHHIISDGWSMGVLIRELTDLYSAFAAGRPSRLPELPVQYADYAAWQRQWLSGRVLRGQVEFWEKELEGAPAALDLPADRPRPPVATYRGAAQPFVVPEELSSALKALSRKHDSTLFMTLTAAFQALLGRCSGQRDVSVGTPVANRNSTETEGLIGFFINTVVLRTRLDGESGFLDLLDRVRSTALRAFSHQDVPFEQVVEALQPERSLSRTPLFQAMLILQNTPSVELQLPGLALRSLASQTTVSQYDLKLSLWDVEGCLQGSVVYSVELFDRSSVRRLLDHLINLMQAAVADPQRCIDEIPLLGQAEERQLLAEWNDTQAEAWPQGLPQLLQKQQEKRPQAAAAAFGDHQLSYFELWVQAGRLASFLRTSGVGREVLAAVCAEPGLELLLALLGVLRAGGAYLPLDPSFPPERLAFMLSDSGASLLLAQRRTTRRLPPHGCRTLLLEDLLPHKATAGQETATIDPQDLAYLIYTSGSTGRPKGVQVTHRSLVNFLQSMARQPGLSPQDTLLAVTTVSFDIAALELFLPLLCGGRVWLANREEGSDGRMLRDRLALSGATAMQATPAGWRMLLESGGQPLPQLKALCGGEALPRELSQRLAQWSGSVWNLYGPTETTVWSSLRQVERRASAAAEGAEPIGRPIANTQVYVLSQRLRPQPVGVAGELCIGGLGLARGYRERPRLTAERFVPDSFGDRPGGRLYRTGDLARRRADGELEYLSRIDQQVKVRGYRIELGEVESALLGHADIRACAVAACADRSGQNRLAAYVVAEEGKDDLRPDQLRGFLAAWLPEYMVPSLFVSLQALPLTPNGKIDRSALPRPEAAALAAGEGFLPPSTASQELLASIWSGVLGLERIGANDHFFDLGGHSLLATQVVSRLRRAFDVELPLRSMFEAPRLHELAGRIDELRLQGQRAVRPPLRREAGPADDLPLSFAQQRLWFLDQLTGADSSFNMPRAARLQGRLDKAALGMAFNEVLRRHEALRTTFISHQGAARQVVAPPVPRPLPEVDLRGIAEPGREAMALRLARQDALRPFDLSLGPLLRYCLLRLGRQDHVLLLTVHHIVFDGWSSGVFWHELSQLYEAFSRGLPSPLEELPVQYSDFARWQRRWLRGSELERQLAYWKQILSDAPASLELPLDKPRPSMQIFRGDARQTVLDARLTDRLRALSLQAGATLFMTLLAAFAALLSRLCSQEDFIVGTPIANRTQKEMEPLIGFFVNTLMLRTDLSGSPDLLELIQRVRRASLDAFDHQDVPFEQLVDELQPERNMSRNTLAQVTFALQNAPSASIKLPGLSLGSLQAQNWLVRNDLEVHAWETAHGLSCTFVFNAELIESATIRRWMKHFRALLEAVASHPRRPLGGISLLNEAERHQALLEWNDTLADRSDRLCLHQLFEVQAGRTPDCAAAVCREAQLSYSELDRRAEFLARRLQAWGVSPETVVGLCLQRSLPMVIGLLGVLKAGCAYLPLEPEYPAQRLTVLLEEGGAPLALTQARTASRVAGAKVRSILLDGEPSSPANGFGSGALSPVLPQNLAYLICTSGSTGRPKAVSIPHQAAVNHMQWMQWALPLSPSDTVLQKTPFHFDASVWEFHAPLQVGARLALAPPASHRDPAQLIEEVLAQQVSVLQMVPSFLGPMVQQGLHSCAALRRVLCGGEELTSGQAMGLKSGFDGELINLYGPTEATIDATFWKWRQGGGRSGVPIGRPVANTQAHVLDSALEPVPIGTPGELFIAGLALARGYQARPGLTAAAFIPDPLASAPGRRLYRSGDLVRRLAGGELEFLGRVDRQVKLRGLRIELREIEYQLGQHPALREGAVALQGEGNALHLAAYAVPDRESRLWQEMQSQQQSERIARWRDLYQDTYGRSLSSGKLDFDTTGWNSSFSGDPIPEEEMRQWVDATVERILSLKPASALEIGCGTGLLTSRIAPHCTSYWATDFSAPVLQQLERLKASQNLENLTILNRTADDLEGIPRGAFDVVILNSVVQYFSGVDYLLRVLDAAAERLSPGGFIWVGDVRHLGLLRAFQASLCRSQASPSMTRRQLEGQVQPNLAREEELLLDPSFFTLGLKDRYPRFERAWVQLKRGRFGNEMTRFRYDALLQWAGGRQPELPQPASIPWLDWQQMTLEKLRRSLVEQQPRLLGLRKVPNARLAQETGVLEWLSSASETETVSRLEHYLESRPPRGIQPEEFWNLGEELSYSVDICWSQSSPEGHFDVILQRRQGDRRSAFGFPLTHFHSPAAARPSREYANNPLQAELESRLEPHLRDFLAARLPEHMLPSRLMLLSMLPRTPGGKLDRKALPATAGRVGQHGLRAPVTPTEELLAGIWAEVLKLEKVGRDDNFFDLGGHSLLAAQALSRIRQSLAVDLPLRALFESQQLESLARRIDQQRQTAQAAESIPRVSRRQDLPLSFAQQRLWFLDQLQPGSAFYNIPLSVRLKGVLDLPALQSALAEIVHRHEALRTVFPARDGKPVQVIRQQAFQGLALLDLKALGGEAREGELGRLARQQSRRPFDLAAQPCFRVQLVRMGEADHALLAVMHHIVSDDWSSAILMRELSALYAAYAQGRPSPLPDLPIQYADYATWQRGWLTGEALEAQLGYWRRRLQDAPDWELPADRKRSPSPGQQGASLSFALSVELSEALRKLSRSRGVTLYMTLLAALQSLLCWYAGKQEICIATTTANRNRSETEGLIGYFVNALVMRTDLSRASTFSELLSQVRETALGAYAHQDIPFDQLVEALRPERALHREPFSQALFTFLSLPAQPLELPGLSLTPLPSGGETAKRDFTLIMMGQEEKLAGSWIYDTDIFDSNTIGWLSAQYQKLLEAVAAQPDARLQELERRQGLMRETTSQQSKFAKLMNIKAKGVDLNRQAIQVADGFPLLIEPAAEGVDLAGWAEGNRNFIESRLHRHGALLFRGFQVLSVGEFERFTRAACPQLKADYGDLPQEKGSRATYKSTPYPNDKMILFHNESSHLDSWPLKQFFCCLKAARLGGETPLVDCRKVYGSLKPGTIRRFRDKGLLYVRNFVPGLDVSWQEFFKTEDRALVEQKCRRDGMQIRWKEDGGLQTRKFGPAVVSHPQTGENLFFNQIQLHHPAFLDAEDRQALKDLFGEQDLPRNVLYGDGSEIEDEVIEEIRRVYSQVSVASPWQEGDLIMLDNMLVAHARNPFEGERKIVVAMGELISQQDLNQEPAQ